MTRAFLLPISLGFVLAACGDASTGATGPAAQAALFSSAAAAPSVNPVVQWNRLLLQIVRTPGAQSPTVHPTRSFAILHAAIYDAVNAIDQTHKPYLVRLPGASGSASQDAAAAAAAHEVLVTLYPSFKSQLDGQLQESLAQVPDGTPKTDGVGIGQQVADRILNLKATTAPRPHPLRSFSAPTRGTTSPPRRISRSSRNSRIGLA